MQKGSKRFLKESNILAIQTVHFAASVVVVFWKAVALVAERQWEDPRRHLLTKGIGVYSLMSLAADLYRESDLTQVEPTLAFFVDTLTGFIDEFDWTTNGPLRGFGGMTGVDEVVAMLRQLRSRKSLKVVTSGE